MYKSILYIFTLLLLVGACASTKNANLLTVASQQGDCVGVGPQKCFLIKGEGQADWEFLYTGIEGFNYEPGYEYVIEVKKEEIPLPAADQASFKYILVKEVSKTKKTSDNMPQPPVQ